MFLSARSRNRSFFEYVKKIWLGFESICFADRNAWPRHNISFRDRFGSNISYPWREFPFNLSIWHTLSAVDSFSFSIFILFRIQFFIVNMFEYSSNLFQYLLVFVFWFGVCFSIYTVDIKPKSNIYTTCTAQIFQRLAAVFFCERKGKQKAKPNKTTSNKLQLFRLCSIYSSSRGRLQIEWKIIRRKRVNRKRIHLAFFCFKRRMMR